MNEVSHYPGLANALDSIIRANVSNGSVNTAVLYEPVDGSDLREQLASYSKRFAHEVSPSLNKFSSEAPKIHTDVVAVFDNPETDRFEIVIVEVKFVDSVGLNELSQLLGYCLVAKASYGLLVNVDGGVSNELAHIMNTDQDLLRIERKLASTEDEIIHKAGVMFYDARTKNFAYARDSALKSIPDVVQDIEIDLSNVRQE